MNEKEPKNQIMFVEVASRAHQRATGAALGDVELNVLIRSNSSMLTDLASTYLAPFGLSTVAYISMMVLYGMPEQHANPSALCTATGETRGNMTRICDELVAKGLIDRAQDPDDRRRINLTLTDDGIDLLNQRVPGLRVLVEEVYAEFSEQEKETLTALMRKLNHVLRSRC